MTFFEITFSDGGKMLKHGSEAITALASATFDGIQLLRFRIRVGTDVHAALTEANDLLMDKREKIGNAEFKIVAQLFFPSSIGSEEARQACKQCLTRIERVSVRCIGATIDQEDELLVLALIASCTLSPEGVAFFGRHTQLFLGDCRSESHLEKTSEKIDSCIQKLTRTANLHGFELADLIAMSFGLPRDASHLSDTLKSFNQLRAAAFIDGGVPIFPLEKQNIRYPATTTVSANGAECTLAYLLMKYTPQIVVVPYENVLRGSAYDRSNFGSGSVGQFSRALLVAGDGASVFFISGIVSVSSGDILFPNNVNRQSKLVLDYLIDLLDSAGRDDKRRRWTSLEEYSLIHIRAILPNVNDASVVKEVLSDRGFRSEQVVFEEGQLSDPRLTVEIEGVFCR